MTNFNYIADYELKRATPYSAGFDLKCIRVSKARELVALRLGVKVLFETEEDRQTHMFILTQRSSFPCRFGLNMVNSPGIIDADYQGELVMICQANSGGGEDIMAMAERCLGSYVAQLIPVKTGSVLVVPNRVEKFNIITQRGEGGFGSTDTEKGN